MHKIRRQQAWMNAANAVKDLATYFSTDAKSSILLRQRVVQDLPSTGVRAAKELIMSFTTATLSRVSQLRNGAQQWVSNQFQSIQQFAAGVGDRLVSYWDRIEPYVLEADQWLSQKCESPESLVEFGGRVAAICAAPFLAWGLIAGVWALIATLLPAVVLAAKVAAIGFIPIAALAYAWRVFQWLTIPENRVRVAERFVIWFAFATGVFSVAALVSGLMLELHIFTTFWAICTISGSSLLVIAAVWRSVEIDSVERKHFDRAVQLLEYFKRVRSARLANFAVLDRHVPVTETAFAIADSVLESAKPELPQPRQYEFVEIRGEQKGIYLFQVGEGMKEVSEVPETYLPFLRSWYSVPRTRELAGKRFWSLFPIAGDALDAFVNEQHMLTELDVQSYNHSTLCLTVEEVRSEIDPVNAVDMAVEPFKDREAEHQLCTRFCHGCSNFHGLVYGDNLLVCGDHPYGITETSATGCPDYRAL